MGGMMWGGFRRRGRYCEGGKGEGWPARNLAGGGGARCPRLRKLVGGGYGWSKAPQTENACDVG